jgi:hypothetical protein
LHATSRDIRPRDKQHVASKLLQTASAQDTDPTFAAMDIVEIYARDEGIVLPPHTGKESRCPHKLKKMEEDVKPKDQDGFDGWGVSGWDGWVCGLGAVGASLVFGLVRGTGAFVTVLPSVVLVSRIQLAPRYRGNITTSFSAESSF